MRLPATAPPAAIPTHRLTAATNQRRPLEPHVSARAAAHAALSLKWRCSSRAALEGHWSSRGRSRRAQMALVAWLARLRGRWCYLAPAPDHTPYAQYAHLVSVAEGSHAAVRPSEIASGVRERVVGIRGRWSAGGSARHIHTHVSRSHSQASEGVGLLAARLGYAHLVAHAGKEALAVGDRLNCRHAIAYVARPPPLEDNLCEALEALADVPLL